MNPVKVALGFSLLFGLVAVGAYVFSVVLSGGF